MISAYCVLAMHAIILFLVLLDFSKSIEDRKKKIIFDIIWIVLVIFAALKNEMSSPDASNYVNYYNNYASSLSPDIFSFKWYEPGFVLLCSIGKTINLNFHYMFMAIGIISISLYRKIILLYSKHIFLSLYIYYSCIFFLNEMIIIRYGLATAIVLYNVKNIVEERYLKAIITVLIAMSFQTVAIIGFMPIILNKVDNKKKSTICLISIIGLVLAILLNFFSIISLLEAVARRIPILEYRIGKFIYINSDRSGGSIKRILLYFPYLFFALNTYKRKIVNFGIKESEVRYNKGDLEITRIASVVLYYVLLSILCMLGLSQMVELGRVGTMLMSVEVIAASVFINSYRKKDMKCVVIIMILLISTYVFYRQNFFNSSGLTFFTF